MDDFEGVEPETRTKLIDATPVLVEHMYGKDNAESLIARDTFLSESNYVVRTYTRKGKAPVTPPTVPALSLGDLPDHWVCVHMGDKALGDTTTIAKMFREEKNTEQKAGLSALLSRMGRGLMTCEQVKHCLENPSALTNLHLDDAEDPLMPCPVVQVAYPGSDPEDSSIPADLDESHSLSANIKTGEGQAAPVTSSMSTHGKPSRKRTVSESSESGPKRLNKLLATEPKPEDDRLYFLRVDKERWRKKCQEEIGGKPVMHALRRMFGSSKTTPQDVRQKSKRFCDDLRDYVQEAISHLDLGQKSNGTFLRDCLNDHCQRINTLITEQTRGGKEGSSQKLERETIQKLERETIQALCDTIEDTFEIGAKIEVAPSASTWKGTGVFDDLLQGMGLKLPT